MDREVSIDMSSLDETSMQSMVSPSLSSMSQSTPSPVQIHLTNGDGNTNDVDSQLVRGRPLHPSRVRNVNTETVNSVNTNEEDEASSSEEGGDSSLWLNLRDALHRQPELRSFLSALERYAPFVLLLISKMIFDNSGSIVVLVCMICTFYHANSVLKQQVGRQARRLLLPLTAVTLNLTACLVFVYIVYADNNDLFQSALLLPPSQVSSVYELLWLTGINDFFLKFVAILVKIGFVAIPASVIPFAHRGKYFLFVERSYQLHRQLAPIPVWLQYLLNYSEIPGKAFGVLLVAAYMVAKGRVILVNARHWKDAMQKLMQKLSYGKCPSGEQVKAAGGMCPICYDSFHHPTLLPCQHIFCEDCLALWFDRERSCPLCRAVITHDPQWRDGATSMFIQVF